MIVHVNDLRAADVEAMPLPVRSAVLFALGYRVIGGAWRPMCQCARHRSRVLS